MKKLLSQIFYNNDFLKRYYKKQFGTMYKQITNNLKGGGFNIEYKDITMSQGCYERDNLSAQVPNRNKKSLRDSSFLDNPTHIKFDKIVPV